VSASPPAVKEFAEPSRPRRTIVRGRGAHLVDADGRTFVDLGATHGAGNLGSADPEVVRAIQDQAAHPTLQSPALASKLCRRLC
jgi:acetylornithine/succinyldiaminopimelate/putrescine aminotransferase